MNETVNKTVEAILARLPNQTMMGPADIATAMGLRTCGTILQAVQCGEMDAVRVGRRYVISRDAAVSYIRCHAVISDERKAVQ